VWAAVAGCILLARPIRPARAEPPARLSQAERVRLLKLAERLLEEAERQHMVDHRMDVTVRSLRRLVADLRSNELFREGRGPRLDKAAGTLNTLGEKHVPAAARHLEEARKTLADMPPKVAAADVEIRLIVQRLTELLARASAAAKDARLNELRVIIQKEQKLREATRQWGREMFQDPAKAEPRRQPLADEQKQINQSLRRFDEHLDADAKAAADKERRELLEKVRKALAEKKVDKTLDRAARRIEAKAPVKAVGEQDKALEDLRGLEEMLKGGDDLDLQRLKDSRERLGELLKKQQELRAKTEQTPKDKLTEAKQDLQLDQRKLANELGDVREDLKKDEPTSQARKPMKQAQQEMAQAEKALQQETKPQATQAQTKAEEHLRKAIKALDEEIAAREAQQELADEQDSEQQALAEALEQIEQMQEKQKELSDQTEKSKPQDLKQVSPPQQQLGQQAQQLSQQVPTAQQALDQAAQEMQQAAQQLAQQAQQPAQQHQQQAQQALEQAARQVRQAQRQLAELRRLEAAQREVQELAERQRELSDQTRQAEAGELGELGEPQDELGDEAGEAGEHNPEAAQNLQRASREMHQAGQHLERGQGNQAQAHQQAAEQALAQAGQQLSQALAQARSRQPNPAHARNSRTQDPDEPGSRDFGLQKPGGQAPGKGKAAWSAMAQRERDALYQNYVGRLPVEYRQLLEDYYEALSK